MTLELAHQLALNKLVELLQTLTDTAEIRRVATAILRVKRPKNDAPPVVDQRETAGAEPPQPPTNTESPTTDLESSPPCLRISVPSSLSFRPTPAAHLIAIAGTTHARRSDASFKPKIEERKDVCRAQSG